MYISSRRERGPAERGRRDRSFEPPSGLSEERNLLFVGGWLPESRVSRGVVLPDTDGIGSDGASPGGIGSGEVDGGMAKSVIF